MKSNQLLKSLYIATTITATVSSHAGRPLAVDDANVNDKGAGHVEIWAARDTDKNTILNLAPAFAPIEGVEFGALLSRDTTNKVSAQALQVKWRITPSQEKGCNVAAVLGLIRVSGGDNATYVSGNASCNAVGSVNVHINLGSVKAKDTSAAGTWGVAVELPRALWTPHVEIFGAERAKSTVQFGARTQLTKELQLDGNVSRNDRQTGYSAGIKYQF
jgi:hypothetical protein